MWRAIALACLLALPLAGEDVAGRVKALVAELSSDDADVRDRATADLTAIGPSAEAHLVAALSTGDPEVRARVQQALDAIRLEQRIGASAWVTLPAKETPLAEAFQELARQTGRKFDSTAVDLTGRMLPAGGGRLPIWEALDRLVRAGGCSYALPFREAITLQPEPLSDAPVCHDGPFRVVLDEVTVTRTKEYDGGTVDSSTDVQMTLEWEGHIRPLAVGTTARVKVATDDKGGSMLLPSDEDGFHDHSRPDDDEDPSQPCWTSLGSPAAGATRIEKLEGEIEVLFLMVREEAVFDAEARRSRATLAAGPVQVQVTSWAPGGEGAVAGVTVLGLGAASGAPDQDILDSFGSLAEMIRFSLTGADGKTVVSGDLSGTTTYGGQDRADFQVGFDSLPPGDFKLSVAVVTKTLSRPVKFTFTGVSLP
ncbi:MAG: HEAT repeat domain-containing protein [Planctomycetota bacterium]